MNLIDLVAAVAIGFGLVRGLMNGVIKEVAGMLGVIIGLWAGLRLAYWFAEYYRAHVDLDEKLIPFLAFLTAFILGLGAVLLAGKLMSNLFESTGLSLINKIAGGLFGALKWAFITGALLNVLGDTGVMPEKVKEGSATWPYLSGYTEVVTEYSIGLIPAAKNVFTEMDTLFHTQDNPNILVPDSTANP